jgi:quinohemoprotein amine dehydrogenase
MRLLTRSALAAAMLFQLLAAQQSTPAPTEPPKEPTEKEKEDLDAGIPITSELVRKTCSPCHKVDDKQRLSRISWRRTTPEGWEQTIKRMISLNGVKMEPAEAREILRYLADNLGLAPEEARPAAFEVEKQMIDYKFPDKDT